jgi:hypothetical protein
MVAAGSWSERIDAMCTRDSGCRVGVNSGGREHLQCGPCTQPSGAPQPSVLVGFALAWQGHACVSRYDGC